jgi:hypothetical protein
MSDGRAILLGTAFSTITALPERALALLHEEGGYDLDVVAAPERVVMPAGGIPTWVAGLAPARPAPAAPRSAAPEPATESTHGPAGPSPSWTPNR